jgi:hypothetical protein
MEGPLDPPSAPFSGGPGYRGSTSSLKSNSDVSLSINYLPSKFSPSLLSGGARKRKGKTGDVIDPVMPKRGGGVEAFRSGEARMPQGGDEDYDGVTGGWLGGGLKPRKLRWNKFKWILFFANVLVCFFALSSTMLSHLSFPL